MRRIDGCEMPHRSMPRWVNPNRHGAEHLSGKKVERRQKRYSGLAWLVVDVGRIRIRPIARSVASRIVNWKPACSKDSSW
jgi:hypothetical protein